MTPTNSMLTPDDVTYLKEIENQSTYFSLEGDVADEAWSRAGFFVSNYSDMKIQNMSDFLIETYNPISPEQIGVYPRYGYKITRLKTKVSNEFTVNVSCSVNGWYDSIIIHNAKMLAYYMKTGIIRPHLISQRIDYSKL